MYFINNENLFTSSNESKNRLVYLESDAEEFLLILTTLLHTKPVI